MPSDSSYNWIFQLMVRLLAYNHLTHSWPNFCFIQIPFMTVHYHAQIQYFMCIQQLSEEKLLRRPFENMFQYWNMATSRPTHNNVIVSVK